MPLNDRSCLEGNRVGDQTEQSDDRRASRFLLSAFS
jgi:hypothetical protein